jgi:NADH-quinone oxidoreductase subunit L
LPLVLLAGFAILLGFIGTPAWPWFQEYLSGKSAGYDLHEVFRPEVVSVLVTSSVIAFAGIGLGWWFYGRKPIAHATQPDALEKLQPDIFSLLQHKFYVDEFYETTVVRFNAWWSRFCDALDFWLFGGVVMVVSYIVIGLSWMDRFIDEKIVNGGFDQGCEGVTQGGWLLSRLQNGQVQNYLRVIGTALAVLGLVLLWGCAS